MGLYLKAAIVATLVGTGALQSAKEPAGGQARFVGTWLSEGGGFANLTTLDSRRCRSR